MRWTYRFDARALKELGKLDRNTQRQIISFLDERVAGTDDPRRTGKRLKGKFAGLWRYRSGDYRIICQLRDRELVVLIVAVGNRRDVYD